MKPMTPSEIENKLSTREFPDEVIKAFNDLIEKDFNGHSATVKQGTVVNLITRVLGISRAEVFEKKLLDIEEVYRRAGWKVDYDRPGYCESYEAYWVFTKKSE